MWHVSSRSGVATLRTALHLLLTYLILVAPHCTTVPSLCVYARQTYDGPTCVAIGLPARCHGTGSDAAGTKWPRCL